MQDFSKRALTLDEVAKVKEILSQPGFERDAAIFAIGTNCGLRAGDICSLTIGDAVKICETGTLRMREEKTNKPKQVIFNQSVKDSTGVHLMRRWADGANNEDALFVSQKGKPLTSKIVNMRIKYVCELAGIDVEDIGSHSMRKTFGHVHHQRGTPIEVLQHIFNHACSRQTMLYVGIVDATEVAVYEDAI